MIMIIIIKQAVVLHSCTPCTLLTLFAPVMGMTAVFRRFEKAWDVQDTYIRTSDKYAGEWPVRGDAHFA